MPPRATYPGAEQFVPDSANLDELRRAASGCRGCDLYEKATQVVFGAGRPGAAIMLVGEQPGDVEDQRGAPFVGPAGGVLHRALADADLDGVPTFVTNAVKHFRWKQTRGKRRIHDKPSAAQSTACRPWLAAELHSVQPRLVVALGATAAASLFGPSFRLTQSRGTLLSWPPEKGSFADDSTDVDGALATIHPSAVLRASDDDRDAAYSGLVADLRVLSAALG
jgi:uracil-DNA glycosylase family protein